MVLAVVWARPHKVKLLQILLGFGVATTALDAAANVVQPEVASVEARLELYRHLVKDAADGCLLFEGLGPVARCARHLASSPKTYPCDPSVGQVRCQRDGSGWYVPFAVNVSGCASAEVCHGNTTDDQSSWTLWYVPFDERAPVRALNEQTVFEESDLRYTTFMRVTDLDGDGIANLVVGRGCNHVEGMGSSEDVYVVSSVGRQVALAANRIADVDQDGLFDILLEFSDTMGGSRCVFDPNDPWDSDTISAPSLLLHATVPGVYTTRDETAQRFRSKYCPPDLLPVVSLRGEIVNEQQTAVRLVCHLANGGRPEDMHLVLDRGCSVPYEHEKDCRVSRPHVCKFVDAFRRWIDNFYRATVFGSRWVPQGTCERCCPLATPLVEATTVRPRELTY